MKPSWALPEVRFLNLLRVGLGYLRGGPFPELPRAAAVVRVPLAWGSTQFVMCNAMRQMH